MSKQSLPVRSMRSGLTSFKSARKFSVFGYSISHGTLLLRSARSDEHGLRLDVLIKDVRALEIRSWFEGIEIIEVEPSFLNGFPSRPIDMLDVGLKVYALLGTGWRGFVVGGGLFFHEDDAGFMEPSALLPEISQRCDFR